MEIALSTLLSQQALSDQVGAAVARKGLDQQKIEGQNVQALLESAVITDPGLGTKVNQTI